MERSKWSKALDLLLALCAVAFLISLLAGGFFSTYYLAFTTLGLGLLFGVVNLTRRQWKWAVIDLVVGIGTVVVYVVVTWFML